MNNSTTIGIEALIAVLLVVGGGAFLITQGYFDQDASTPDGEQVYCTMEAKECPDGSYVGRTGPKCEFTACPATPASGTSTGTVALGSSVVIQGTTIGALELMEDSRCPVDVQCIQAGTVRLRVAIDTYNKDFTFKLGEAQTVNGAVITLISVSPGEKRSTVTVKLADYRFTFSVKKPAAAAAAGTLSGTMTVGPICPVERIPPDPACKPSAETYAAHKVFVYKSDKKTLVTTLTPNAEGKFSSTLPVGDYWVDVEHRAGPGGASGVPKAIHISANTTTTISIDIDTGIR